MRNFTRNFKMFTLAIALFSMSAGAVGQGQIIYETGFESSDGFIAGTVYNQELTVGPEGKQWKTSNGTPSTTTPISGAQSMQMRAYKNSSTIPFVATDFALSKVTKVEFSAANTGGLNITVDYSTDGINYIGGQDFELSASKKEYSYTIDENGVNIVKLRFIITNPTVTAIHRVYIDDLKVYGVITGPSVSTTPSSIILNSSIGAESTENINIKGTNLTGDLTIAVAGDAFSTTVSTVSQADATAGFDIPVKFAPTARGVFSGQLIISGGGLEDNVNVALSGTAYELIEVNSISQLYSKDVTLANTRYKLTSEAVVTFDYTKNRGQYYIQDATAGLLIDDASKLIATKFSEGDGMKNIEGTLSLYYGVLQFVATSDATKSSTGNSVTPKTITLEQLVTGNYVSQLIKVVNVSISGTGSFEAKKSYAINDDVDVRTFDFTYTAIISEVKNIIGIAVEYTTSTSTKYQISPRSDADLINVPTAIGNLVNDQSIYVQNGQLIVVAQNSGAMVEVYNIAGQRVATQATDAGRNVITLPKGQIYIVKVGNTVKKVAL